MPLQGAIYFSAVREHVLMVVKEFLPSTHFSFGTLAALSKKSTVLKVMVLIPYFDPCKILDTETVGQHFIKHKMT